MTEFEVFDTEEVEFTDEPKKPVRKAVVNKVKTTEIKPASSRSVSYMEDYTKPAGQPRIFEVLVETVDYNKGGTKVNYSHLIKYPGHEEFFNEQ